MRRQLLAASQLSYEFELYAVLVMLDACLRCGWHGERDGVAIRMAMIISERVVSDIEG